MCLDGECEVCGSDRRDFLIGGAAAFAGVGASGAAAPISRLQLPDGF
jgi:hypothetical protein